LEKVIVQNHHLQAQAGKKKVVVNQVHPRKKKFNIIDVLKKLNKATKLIKMMNHLKRNNNKRYFNLKKLE